MWSNCCRPWHMMCLKLLTASRSCCYPAIFQVCTHQLGRRFTCITSSEHTDWTAVSPVPSSYFPGLHPPEDLLGSCIKSCMTCSTASSPTSSMHTDEYDIVGTRQTQVKTETHGHSAHSTNGSSDNLLTNRNRDANHKYHSKCDQPITTWD